MLILILLGILIFGFSITLSYTRTVQIDSLSPSITKNEIKSLPKKLSEHSALKNDDINWVAWTRILIPVVILSIIAVIWFFNKRSKAN